MSDPARLTATEAARQMARGALRPEALLEACLARIASDEGRVQAFASFDAEQVRGIKPQEGALHGLPIGVKDVLDTADMASEYGSPIWKANRPRADAACVAWARAAGAVVMGKTVTTEFATRKPGATANPHNAAHTPGGSSSGSAAGVAAGFFPLAFGTQTAGSIIRPAAYCGVVGYKPSFGTIARLGMKVMSESLDTIGVMARSVADCALLVGAVAGRDFGDPDKATGAMPRIGICVGPSGAEASPETMVLLERAAETLAAAGAIIVRRPLPDAYSALASAQPLVMNAESAASMGWELAARRSEISVGLVEKLDWGRAQGPDALDAARAVMAQLQSHFDSVVEDVDVLLTPSAQGEAPLGLEWTGDPMFNALWTALHVPCVTIPVGTGPAGLPLGLQIVAARGQDRAALAWAQWIASALGG
jgi:Asp-tRNA(Asn)/Glu-tRNA(Gln) amidotransferase A subunit family amidase